MTGQCKILILRPVSENKSSKRFRKRISAGGLVEKSVNYADMNYSCWRERIGDLIKNERCNNNWSTINRYAFHIIHIVLSNINVLLYVSLMRIYCLTCLTFILLINISLKIFLWNLCVIATVIHLIGKYMFTAIEGSNPHPHQKQVSSIS